MVEVLQKGVSGLFYRDALTTADGEVGAVFCKPINVRIYSAPPPVRCRLVTYELIYWLGADQPKVSDNWGEVIRYVRPCGRRRFSYTTGTLSKSLSLVLDDIRQHAHSVVFTTRPLRSAEEGLDRYLMSNTTTRAIEINEQPLRIKNLHHVVYVKLNDNKDHVVSAERVHYELEGTEDIAIPGKPIPITYDDNRRLIDQTVSVLQNTE